MRLTLTGEFQEIPITTGTIQNRSETVIELAPTDDADTGLLLWPDEKFSFVEQTVFARSTGGRITANVVPFLVFSETRYTALAADTERDITEYSGTLRADTKRIFANGGTLRADTKREVKVSERRETLLVDTRRVITGETDAGSGGTDTPLSCGERMREHLLSQFWWEAV